MKGTGTGLPPDPRMSVYFDDPFQIGAFDVTDTLTIDYRDPTAPSTNPYGTYVILPGDSMINYFGSIAGAGQSNVNNPGKAFANSDSPILFMTYAELKFIEAECSFRNGDAANAALAYNNAINASMDQHAEQLLLDGVSTTTFLDSVANETSSGITIEKIFTQKYIQMFCQGTEGFTDWRRSHDATHPDGIPTIYLAVEANTAQVPRRLPYPNSERLQNGINLSNAIANQGGASLTDRVWWDH